MTDLIARQEKILSFCADPLSRASIDYVREKCYPLIHDQAEEIKRLNQVIDNNPYKRDAERYEWVKRECIRHCVDVNGLMQFIVELDIQGAKSDRIANRED